MLWIILSLPFLVWAWWGVTFTTLIYVAEKVKEAEMLDKTSEPELARIIRYTDLSEFEANGMPGLLSFFQADKNILHIDHNMASLLPEYIRNRLEFTTEVFTMVVERGESASFEPYNQEVQSPGKDTA